MLQLGPLSYAGRLAEALPGERVWVFHGETRSRRLVPSLGLSGAVVTGPTWDGEVEQQSVVVGVGGGSVIDRAKLAAYNSGSSFISVPTVLSSDGIGSPVAVIEGESRFLCAPDAVLVDLDVVRGAPVRYNAAGAGDLLSNLSALHDWQGWDDPDFNERAAGLSQEGALRLLEALEGGGEWLKPLARGLALSGEAMALAGSSRPASGSEHMLCHALDRLGYSFGLHGEQTAFASVFTTLLQGNPHRERMVAAFKKLGLPTRLSDTGLSKEQLLEAVRLAPSTRPDRKSVFGRVSEEEAIMLL